MTIKKFIRSAFSFILLFSIFFVLLRFIVVGPSGQKQVSHGRVGVWFGKEEVEKNFIERVGVRKVEYNEWRVQIEHREEESG